MTTSSLKSGAGCLGLLFLLLFLLLGAPIAGAAVPEPIVKWTFEGDARDSVGSLHGELLGDATIANGRLVLHGNGFVRTAPLTSDLAARTLVARVKVESVAQWGGGVMAVQTTNAAFSFEKLAFNSGGYWEVGSQGITKGYYEAFAEVTPAFVHLALTFAADGTFVLYRNGRQHGEPFRPQAGLRTFGTGAASILFGWPGNLRGEIEEAALYDRTLTAAEVAELAGVGPVDDQEQVMLGFATSELVMEESTIGSIILHRTGRLDQSVSATLELRAGSAEVTGEGADVFLMGQNPAVLTFQPGQTEMAVQIRAQLDLRDEAPESASLLLTKAGSATVQGGLATITVIPWINRVRTGGLAAEIGQSHIYLELLTGMGGVVRVQTTSAGTATPGVDFVPVDREVSLTGSLGQRVVYVPLTVIRDGRIEGDETIGIRVTAVTDNTEVNPTDLLLTLQDEPVQIYSEVDPDQLLPSGQVAEATGVLRFILKRSSPTDSPDVFQVRYRVEGMAQAFWEGEDSRMAAEGRPGIDFEPAEGLVEFGPRVSSQVVEIPLLNDSEPDGPRGLVLRLLGSPEFPDFPGLAENEAGLVILDDERAALAQEMAIAPFLPELRERPRAISRPNGSTLLQADHRLVQLLPSGTPDPDFGEGTGHVRLPRWPDWDPYPVPQSLPDGRLVFAEGTRIVRLTARGALDPTFGSGSGTVELRDSIWKSHVAADGSLTLLTADDRGTYLRRLQPSGEADPAFSGLNHPQDTGPDDLAVTRQGHLWLGFPNPWPDDGHQWRRVLANGQSDPDFAPRPGLMACFGVDESGRAYFQLKPEHAEQFGDATQGGLVRFLADGSYDAQYRPARPKDGRLAGARVDSCEVSPDGTCLVVVEGNRIEEFTPDGQFSKSFPVIGTEFRDLAILSATRGMGGTLRVMIQHWDFFCWPGPLPNCGSMFVTELHRLGANGEMTWLERLAGMDLPWRLPSFHDAPSSHWRWVEAEKGAPNQSVSSQPRIWREAEPPAVSHVGFDRSGLSTTNPTVRLQVARAGSTATAGRVRGKVYEAGKGRWDAVPNSGFELPFPAESGSAQLELTLTAPDAGTPLREYLVRLESADGVELSPWTDCRLWLFDVGRDSTEGELRIATPAAPDNPDTHWLLAHWPKLDSFDWSQSLQVKGTLRGGDWEHLFFKVTEPATQAIPVQSGFGPASRFFRIAQ